MKQIIFSLLSVLIYCLNSNAQSVTQLTGFDIKTGFDKNIYDITRLNNETALIITTKPKMLWRTDGTKLGTYLIHDFEPELGIQNGLFCNILAVLDGKAIMLVSTDTYGKELWVSDGTVTGTHLLVDFIAGSIGLVDKENITNKSVIINNECYFLIKKDNKFQLMKTDGSVNGTEIYINDVGDIDSSLDPNDMPKLFLVGNFLYYSYYYHFYKIDFTTKTTLKIPLMNAKDLADMEQINDSTLIFAYDQAFGASISRFNFLSNELDTLKSFDYYFSLYSGYYLHKVFYKFNNSFYFCGSNNTWNIYKTDGTIAGTQLLKKLEQESKVLIEYNNKLWFDNYDNTLYAIFSLDNSGTILKELDSENWAGGAEKGFVLLDDNRFLISGYFKSTGNDWEPHIFDPLTSKLTKVNANPISDSYPQLFTKLKDHNYLFYGTDPDWDGSLFLLNLIPNSTTNQTSNQDIQVYPNPANVSWTIETKNLDLNKASHYKIIDILGNEIANGRINNVITNIDATVVEKGVYFLEIESKQAHQTIKLIKQ